MLTPGMEEALSNEIKALKNDNKVLQGKIRGYQTLGQLFKELKEKNKILEMNQQKNMVSVATEMEAEPCGPTDKYGTNSNQPKNETASIPLHNPANTDISIASSIGLADNHEQFSFPENSENSEELNNHLKKKLEDALQIVEEYERKRSNDKKLLKIFNVEIKKNKDALQSTQEKLTNALHENNLMMTKIRKLEQERDSIQLNIGATATVTGEIEGAEDWVHLHGTIQENSDEIEKAIEIQELTEKCKELEGKATRWEREHFNLQREYTKHSAELRCLLEAKSKEFVKVTGSLNTEKNLLEMKFKKLESMLEAEKKTTIEAQHNYEETFKKYKTLEKKFLALEQKNKNPSWVPTERKESLASQMGPTSSSQEQVLMLKQQVVLFKDDFENERKERIFAEKQQKEFEEKLVNISKQLEKKESQLVKCEKSLAEEGLKTEKLIQKVKNLDANYKRVSHHNHMLMDMQSKMGETTQPIKVKEVFPSPFTAPKHSGSVAFKCWTCECCTFINDCQVEICKMCKAPRPSAPVPSNDRWKCRSCTFSNNNFLDKCTMCHVSRNTVHIEGNFDEDLDIDGPYPKHCEQNNEILLR